MPLRKLFLSHHSRVAHEVAELATELRLRGIVPWVDKDGGFSIGDDSPAEARRAIREDCFGFLLYSTKEAFDRRFITDVEFKAALEAKDVDPSFLLFAVPRGLSFAELRELSSAKLSFDLSPFHTVALGADTLLPDGFRGVSKEVLRKVVRMIDLEAGKPLVIQFSTVELLPHETNEAVCIDAAPLLSSDPTHTESWGRLLVGLRELKSEVSTRWSRPRLQVEGSKQLTAAFMFGRVFSPMRMDIRQTPTAYWSSDAEPCEDVLKARLVLEQGEPILTMEIAGRLKDVAAGVDALVHSSELRPGARLQLGPINGPLNIDNAVCCSMVRQAYRELEKSVQRLGMVREIHIFGAVPQAFMMMLGREFRGMPSTVHYEWSGDKYVRACSIPGGVL